MQDNVMEFVSGSIEYIQRDVDDIKKSFIRLGFHLWENSYFRYYEYTDVRHPEDFGSVYGDVYDFALDYFGLSRSTCSRLINICTKFCNNKMFLLPEYSDYNYSQLSEMLSMDEGQLRSVRPSMSILDIRRMKKGLPGTGARSAACALKSPQVVDVITVTTERSAAPDADKSETTLCDVAQGAPATDDIEDLRERVLTELFKLDKTRLQKLLSMITNI